MYRKNMKIRIKDDENEKKVLKREVKEKVDVGKRCIIEKTKESGERKRRRYKK